MTKHERYAPLIAGVLLALPSLLSYYLPMNDLALHEGAVGVLLHFGDESYFPKDLYQLNPGHPNQLFHAAAWLVSLVTGTRWAVKIVVALAQVMVFVTGARLADYLGRSRWAALLLAPLALGFTYYWGLVANLLGFSALLFAVPILDRANEAPTPRRAAAALGVLVLAYLAHESVFVIAVGFVGFVALVRPFPLRGALLRFAPATVTFALAVFQLRWSRKFFTAGQLEPAPIFVGPIRKLSVLPSVLFGAHDTEATILLLVLGLVALVALAVTRMGEQPPPEADETPSWRARIHSLRVEIFGGLMLVAYFLSPLNWRGATLLHERFLPIAWALLSLSAAPARSPTRIAKLGASTLPLAIMLLSWPQFLDAHATGRALADVLARIPRGASVTFLVLHRPTGERVYAAGSQAWRTLAENGGRISEGLVTSPISPVLIAPQYRWNKMDRRLARLSHGLRPSHDLKMFGWLIVVTREPWLRELALTALASDAEPVVTSGEWTLLKSRYPPYPVASPELPPEPGDLVVDRIRAIDAARHGGKTRIEAPPRAVDDFAGDRHH